jgi:uroporphyrinogen decarboxylase
MIMYGIGCKKVISRKEKVNSLERNERFLYACNRAPVDQIPVWYMRQAGRYQPEYRKIREKYSLMEICEIPDVCAEVTLLPVQQLGVDAAILFSDIMIPIKAMGCQVDIKGGYGPVIEHPIRQMSDLQKLRRVEPEEDLPKTLETIRILRRELKVPLIGFTGAPFTLASYLVEGGPSRNYLKTKSMMFSSPELWKALMDRLADMVITYARAQVEAGAEAVQMFDSWVGSLSPQDYRRYVFPTMKRIAEGLSDLHAPLIYFGVNTAELLPIWRELSVDVIGIDWRISIPEARNRVGSSFAIQGNLDPAILLAPWEVIEERAKEILDQGMEKPGFIFNLGHGVFPEVRVETLQRLTEFVHTYSSNRLKETGRMA